MIEGREDDVKYEENRDVFDVIEDLIDRQVFFNEQVLVNNIIIVFSNVFFGLEFMKKVVIGIRCK